MDVLFATENPAKVKTYLEPLKKNGINLITINDLDFKLEINENGKTAIENARIKAKTYYDKLKIPTIGMDNNLFFPDLPEDKQPGTHVRRVNGKRLSDEEMIEYYIDLVKKYGNPNLNSCWKYGMVIYNNNKEKDYSWSKFNFILIDKPSIKRNPGYPLDSITIVPKYNKYLVELTKQEKEELNHETGTDKVVEFMLKALKNY